MTQAGTEIELSRETIAMFVDMLPALEEFDAGGADNILQQILTATTVDEYNKAFDGDRALPMGHEIKVEQVRYARSDFAAGLPFYLVVDGVDVSTGKSGQWTVGATSVVAALSRATFLDQLPVMGKATPSERETKAGYRPVNWVMTMVTDNSQQTLDADAKAKK